MTKAHFFCLDIKKALNLLYQRLSAVMVEAMRDYLFLRIFKISEVRHHADAWFFAIKIFKKLL